MTMPGALFLEQDLTLPNARLYMVSLMGFTSESPQFPTASIQKTPRGKKWGSILPPKPKDKGNVLLLWLR